MIPEPIRLSKPIEEHSAAERRALLGLVADKLEQLPPEKFSIFCWVKGHSIRRCVAEGVAVYSYEFNPECDTAACVYGWCNYLLPTCGFHLHAYFNRSSSFAAVMPAFSAPDIFAEVFALSNIAAKYIIMPESYASYDTVSPSVVVGRIRLLLDNHHSVAPG